eukprot:CAMPEP_0119079936 /NCGR_PEP_ID=MMETSP1178-20130426/109817_1 /TAXON_ID=33656 /ORGANISM="unid sp, Strain CCMP2000" /LENGTH=122 /DNA_ID=CAMNT_0007062493 /DNA_START=24 /DNA_END=392 /DNA_ORIENTATION=+
MSRVLFLLALLSAPCAAFVAGPLRAMSTPRVAAAPVALHLDPTTITDTFSLLAEIVDADGERAYGAVEAPGWVLPLGAVLAIGTSLLPILLSPGEEAFLRQQGDEEATKGVFGRGKGNQRKF